MAMWLFRRRSRRKRPHSGTQPGDDGQPSRSRTAPVDDFPDRQISVKKQRTDRTEHNKLQRRVRTYSFESGRNDDIRLGRQRSTREAKRGSAPPTHLPGANPSTSASFHKKVLAARFNGEQKETFDRSQQEDAAFDRVPTLYAKKRDGHHLMSRKLSKRRKDSHDREREAELKHNGDFKPVRPATDVWTSGRPMRKESRRVRSGLALKHPWEKEQHPSDVSLPIPESIHSSLSSDSEQVSFKVSAFAVLAPKPTLRYTLHPRWESPHSYGSAPARHESVRRKVSDRQIPEATLKAHKRVDDLADDLTASDLRELMERDNRRRERKRDRESQKIERKLAKAVEKQRQAEEDGRESPPNLERGVVGRETAGLGIDRTSAILTSSKHRSSPTPSPKSLGKRPAGWDQEHDLDTSPVHSFHRVDSIPSEPEVLETKKPAQETPEPVLPVVQADPTPVEPQIQTPVQNLNQSPKATGFLRSKKRRSTSPPVSDPEHSDTSGTPRKTSANSSRWTSIFKWGRAKRTSGPSGPSSFSNTSRDSMATQPQVTSVPVNVNLAPAMAAVSRANNLPKRTRSRFREDLPELPLSPPDSRMQSPEHDPMPTTIMEQETPSPDAFPPRSAPINIPGARYDTPNSDAMRVDPSPEPPQSMSLASIDSEGSWFGGRKKGNRGSMMRDSLSQRQFPPSIESDNATEKADRMETDSATGIADDEFLSRVASHGSNPRNSASWPVGEARPSSDNEDDARWGSVGGRQPVVVQAFKSDRMKSREVLLTTLSAKDDEDRKSETGEIEIHSPVSANSDGTPNGLQRATSVNLGKGHARHISAGSAKLLELSPRSSLDTKRRSLSGMASPLASPVAE